jgi:hypothetical protein
MADPSLALQDALVATLRAGSPPELDARVYDSAPPDASFPYVTVGDDQVTADHAECLEGSVEIATNVHVWSRGVGKVEAKQIAGWIVATLNYAPLTLVGYRLVLIEHDGTHHLGDPDGLTSHSVVTFRALIDEQ